jgi:hypothetical protein
MGTPSTLASSNAAGTPQPIPTAKRIADALETLLADLLDDL